MTFGEYLKKERLQQGKTRKEIAEAVGVTERTVQYWENDQRNLTLNNAAKLAVALGINISIWLGGDTSVQYGNHNNTERVCGKSKNKS